MRSILNIVRHKYFKVSAAIAMIVFLPAVLILNQQQQEIRSKAAQSTTLSFSPASTSTAPILKKVGDNFYLDLMLNPGANLVTLVKLDILYDSTKMSLSPTNPLVVNQTIFPQIVEGPVYNTGRIQLILSVGFDHSKAISTTSRAVTLNFVAKAPTSQTVVSFGPNNQIYSVAANDSSVENVLSSTTPAFIKIAKSTGKGSGGKGRK